MNEIQSMSIYGASYLEPGAVLSNMEPKIKITQHLPSKNILQSRWKRENSILSYGVINAMTQIHMRSLKKKKPRVKVPLISEAESEVI